MRSSPSSWDLNARLVSMRLDPGSVRMPGRIVFNAATTYRPWKVAEPRCCETQFASFNEAAGGGAGIHYSNHATVMGLIRSCELHYAGEGIYIELLFWRSNAILEQEVALWSVVKQVKSWMRASTGSCWRVPDPGECPGGTSKPWANTYGDCGRSVGARLPVPER